jgi:hypothetical protein
MRQPKNLEKNLPSATLSTTNSTWSDPRVNPHIRGERPTTERLSHGTALSLSLINFILSFHLALYQYFPVFHNSTALLQFMREIFS